MINKNLKSIISPVIAFILVVIVWKSAAFLKESYFVLPTILSKKLPFKESSVKLGGDEAASFDFADKTDSDDLEKKIFLNYVQVENYTVHYPIDLINVKTWDIDIRFKELRINKNTAAGFDLLQGVVYIDLDNGIGKGSDKPLFDNENILFSDDFYWDYRIDFNPYNNKAKMKSFTGQQEYDVGYILLNDKKTLRLEVPLIEEINGKMNKKEMGRQLAAFGFTSISDNDKEVINKYFPDKYYSFAASSMVNVEKGSVRLIPVSVDNTDIDDDKKKLDIPGKLEAVLNSNGKTNNFKPSDYELIKTGYELYMKGNIKEAETELMKYKDSSSTAGALIAVITAKKAKTEKNLIKKIQFVENAYTVFKESESLIDDDADRYIFYMNRSGTSMEVPDEVFGKLESAEADLRKILTLKLTEKEKARCYLNLIKIYELKKKNKIQGLYEEIKKVFGFEKIHSGV